jgi:hypothetical protein
MLSDCIQHFHPEAISRNNTVFVDVNLFQYSVAFSPQANYADWATAAGQRMLVPTFADRGMSRGLRGGTPTAVNLSFLDRSCYFFSVVALHLSSRGWVDPVPDWLLLRKSSSAGKWTRALWDCSPGTLTTIPHKRSSIGVSEQKILHGTVRKYFYCSRHYLGLHFDKGLTWRTHIFAKRKQRGTTLTKMYCLLGRKSKLSTCYNILIYKAINTATNLYLWNTTVGYGSHLMSWHNPTTGEPAKRSAYQIHSLILVFRIQFVSLIPTSYSRPGTYQLQKSAFYMPLYILLHNLLNVLVQTANCK